MNSQRLDFTINCAPIQGALIDAVINIILNNPFGTYRFLIDDSSSRNKEESFNEEKLRQLLKDKSTWELVIYDHVQEGTIEMSMTQTRYGSNLIFVADIQELDQSYEKFRDYALLFVKILPQVSQATITEGNSDLSALYRELNLDRPPACFTTRLRWVHWLGPQYYSLFLEREDLLGTPAHEVQELENGLIEIMVYKNPFEWHTSDNRQKLIEVTRYLNTRPILS